MTSITISNRAPMRVACVAHQGNYSKIGGAFEKLAQKTMSSEAVDWQIGMMGIYYDDPRETKPEEMRSAAAVALKAGEEIAGLETREISGGNYAMLEVKGSYEQLPEAWEAFSDLVAADPHMFRDAPSLEFYLNNPEETAPEDLMTILAIAIK